MSNENVYIKPKADVLGIDFGAADYGRLDRVASGQRILIYSLIASFILAATREDLGSGVVSVIAIATIAASIFGAIRVDHGLGGSLVSKILYAISMLLPLVSLIIMMTLSFRATKALQNAGYEVGFFGVKQRGEI